MTDRLDRQLGEAGELLRAWRDEQIGEPGAVSSDGTTRDLKLLPLDDDQTPIPAPIPSWRRWPIAAAVVLLVGAVAAFAAFAPDGGDGGVAVTAGPTPVALIPDEELLAEHTLVRTTQLGPGHHRLPGVALQPDGTDDESLWVWVGPEIWHEPTFATEVVSGSGITGLRHVDQPGNLQYLWFVGEPGQAQDDVRLALAVRASLEHDLDHLLELAAQIDIEQHLDPQEPDGWRRLASIGGDASVRHFMLLGPIREEIPRITPSLEAASTWIGEGAERFIPGPGAERMELAGREVIVGELRRPGETMITWIEEPGLVVQLNRLDEDATHEERLAYLEAAMQRMVPVDEPGWEQFAAGGLE